jgi:hypothetical protein
LLPGRYWVPWYLCPLPCRTWWSPWWLPSSDDSKTGYCQHKQITSCNSYSKPSSCTALWIQMSGSAFVDSYPTLDKTFGKCRSPTCSPGFQSIKCAYNYQYFTLVFTTL